MTEITDLFGDRDEEAMYQAAESLAAARLADQEAIERHVTKRVARECYQIACGCEFGYTAAKTIREKYGVE